jgi:tetratricopeptide (TPR) repeat protein
MPRSKTRVAIEWALSHVEKWLAARIIPGFCGPYERLIGTAEVRSQLEAALEGLDAAAQPALAARAWWALADIAVGSRKIEAAQRAVEFAQRADDALTTIDSLRILVFGLYQAGRLQEAQPVVDRALRLAKESGLIRSAVHAYALEAAAIVASFCGRLEEAEETYVEALSLATEHGDEIQAIRIRGNMGELEFRKGNAAEALELVKEIQVQTQGSRTVQVRIFTRAAEAAYRIALGDIPGARSAAREALRLARGAFALPTTWAMQHLATIAALGSDPRRGARLRGYVDASYRNIGCEPEMTEQHTYDILLTALREKLTDAEIESLAAEGAQLSEDQAVAEALAV